MFVLLDLFFFCLRVFPVLFRPVDCLLVVSAFPVCASRSVQLSGPDGPITVGEHSRLSTVKPHPLADGLEHVVKIVYYNFINYDFIDDLTASSALLPFLKDGGEVCRL